MKNTVKEIFLSLSEDLLKGEEWIDRVRKTLDKAKSVALADEQGELGQLVGPVGEQDGGLGGCGRNAADDEDTACDQTGEEDQAKGLLENGTESDGGCFHGSDTSFQIALCRGIIFTVFIEPRKNEEIRNEI